MLARPNRLTKKKDIELVYKKGRVVADNFFRIKYILKSQGPARATVIVSKKVSPLAVKRNSIKRQLRPLVNQLIKKQLKSIDLMLIVQPAIKQLKRKEILRQAGRLFDKLLKKSA